MEHLIAKVKYKGNEYYYAAYITGGCSEAEQLRNFSWKVGKLYSVMATDKRVGKVNIKPYEVVRNIFNHYKI